MSACADDPPPAPVCGNGEVESGETCDLNCVSECDDGDPCTVDSLTGAAELCNARCVSEAVTVCVGDDFCCPDGCSADDDIDCNFSCLPLELHSEPALALPADEGAHGAELEWWYWTGHLRATDGRRFGFQVVVFLSSVSGVWGQVGHHAITDISAASFHHRSDYVFGMPPEIDGGFELVVPQISAIGGGGRDHLSAQVDGYSLDLDVVSTKPTVLQHEDGYMAYPFGGDTYYFSRERMEAAGTLDIGSETLTVEGSAWFDHQWGELGAVRDLGWDWFALQLDDGREIMALAIYDGGVVVMTDGTITDASCNSVALDPAEIQVTPLSTWTSPHTGCVYPMGWELSVGEMQFTVTPVLEDQELHTLFPDIPYWEGAATVAGDGTGRAYVELTGYCD